MGSRLCSVALICLLSTIAACVPGYQVSEGGEPMQIVGRLGGDDTPHGPIGIGCIWLTGANGRRTPLLVMDEAVVKFDPVRLVGANGRVIASEGDIVTAIGKTWSMGDNGCPQNKGLFDGMFPVDQLIGPGGTWKDPLAEPALSSAGDLAPPREDRLAVE